MKNIFSINVVIVALLCTYNHGYAGSKILYYDASWHQVSDKKCAVYYRTVDLDKKGDNYFVTDRYLKSRKTQMTGYYTDYNDENKRDGYFIYYDSLENRISEGRFKNNQEAAQWKYYYYKYDVVNDFRLLNTRKNYFYSLIYNDEDSLNVCDSIQLDSTILNSFSGVAYTEFEGYFGITNTIINDPADIEHSVFSETANFSNDSFSSLNLSSCAFYDTLTFIDNYVKDNLLFADGIFYKPIKINRVVEGKNGQIIFNNATLPDTIDFSFNDKISNEIDLLAANFKDSCRIFRKVYRPHYINLYKSDISKFHLDYFHFKLYFPPHLSQDEQNSVYEALLNNFKNRGLTESFEKLDIEYRNFKYGVKKQHWLSRIDEWWWNYSYNKELVFVHAAFFLLFFTVITFMILGFLNDEVYSMDDIQYNIPLKMKKFGNENNVRKQLAGSKYVLASASNKTLADILQQGSLDIKIQPVENDEQSIYSLQYKSMIYLFFLAGFTIFMFGYYWIEQYVLSLNVINIVAAHKILVIICAAVITLLLLILWLMRRHVSKNRTIAYINQAVARFWLALVYTSKLFFPVFIKIENLKYKHRLLVFYILFVYLIGLLCVGYMTNFVLQK